MGHLKVDLVSDAAGTGPADLYKQWAPKMVARLSVPSGVPTMVKTLNVSSVVDFAVGDTTINFTSSFSDANFMSHTSAGESGTNAESARRLTTPYAQTTTTLRVICFDGTAAGSTGDPVSYNASCNGDLA